MVGMYGQGCFGVSTSRFVLEGGVGRDVGKTGWEEGQSKAAGSWRGIARSGWGGRRGRSPFPTAGEGYGGIPGGLYRGASSPSDSGKLWGKLPPHDSVRLSGNPGNCHGGSFLPTAAGEPRWGSHEGLRRSPVPPLPSPWGEGRRRGSPVPPGGGLGSGSGFGGIPGCSGGIPVRSGRAHTPVPPPLPDPAPRARPRRFIHKSTRQVLVNGAVPTDPPSPPPFCPHSPQLRRPRAPPSLPRAEGLRDASLPRPVPCAPVPPTQSSDMVAVWVPGGAGGPGRRPALARRHLPSAPRTAPDVTPAPARAAPPPEPPPAPGVRRVWGPGGAERAGPHTRIARGKGRRALSKERGLCCPGSGVCLARTAPGGCRALLSLGGWGRLVCTAGVWEELCPACTALKKGWFWGGEFTSPPAGMAPPSRAVHVQRWV